MGIGFVRSSYIPTWNYLTVLRVEEYQCGDTY